LLNIILPGVELIEAVNGQIAVEMFKKIKPDLTFMDAQMPELDGKEVTIAIQKQKEVQALTSLLLASQPVFWSHLKKNGYPLVSMIFL
jgi:CheY-like chemotaxis protein